MFSLQMIYLTGTYLNLFLLLTKKSANDIVFLGDFDIRIKNCNTNGERKSMRRIVKRAIEISVLSVLLAMMFVFIDAYDVAANEVDSAIPLVTDKLVTGELTDNNPEEYYEIEMKESGKIYMETKTYAEYMTLTVYDSSLTYIDSAVSDSSDGRDTLSVEVAKGKYYIKVSASYDGNGVFAYGKYEFTPFISYANANFETNHTKKIAAKISFNKKIKGHIAINDNSEYFKIIVPIAGKMTINYNTKAMFGFLDIYKGDFKVSSIVAENINSDGKKKTTINVKKGVYYIYAHSSQIGYGSYYGAFSFDLDFTPSKIISQNIIYNVLSDNTVSAVGSANSKLTKINIPATVKYGNKAYKVVTIKKQAFRANKKVTAITIGSNVQKIEEQAFSKCSNLRTIQIKSSQIKKIGKNAFTGASKELTIKVPEKKNKNLNIMLKKAGLKKYTIKSR